jgi:hypothetical protein
VKLDRILYCLLAVSGLALGQAYNPPRMANGKPNLQGIWEARSTAWGSVEAHGGSEGIRAGESIVVDPADGKIPYLPAALAQREENFKNRAKLDPLNKCWMPGVPRITYMPYPFQIFQTPDFMVILYEYVHASRTIHMSGDHLDGIDIWMGDSRGKWDGDTFVVDVTNNDPHTWLDASGNHHSRDMHVVERYTRTTPNILMYEAIIEDPKIYSKPWKIRVPLYLHDEMNAQLYEYECNVYREEAQSK